MLLLLHVWHCLLRDMFDLLVLLLLLFHDRLHFLLRSCMLLPLLGVEVLSFRSILVHLRSLMRIACCLWLRTLDFFKFLLHYLLLS